MRIESVNHLEIKTRVANYEIANARIWKEICTCSSGPLPACPSPSLASPPSLLDTREDVPELEEVKALLLRRASSPGNRIGSFLVIGLQKYRAHQFRQNIETLN